MTSRHSTLRPSSSASWLGSLATTGPDLRFSTFGAPGSGSGGGAPRRKAGAALFEEDLSSGAGQAGAQGRDSVEEGLGELRGLECGREQGWSVTVAEGPKARSRSRKPDPTLTVYVSTPTSSLTLSRKMSELVDLEARLRSQFPGRVPSGQPKNAPPTPKKRNTVLASLTRTLSPRRGDKASFSSSTSSSAADLHALSATLTAASVDESVRAHAAWLKFFAVRRDDLESARVERRIKRARSDQTMHLALEPVPVPVSIPVSVSTAHDARDERQEPSAASGATEELVDSVVGDDGDGEPAILAMLGQGNDIDSKYVAPIVVEPAGKEDDVELEIKAPSMEREGPSESGSPPRAVNVDLAPEQDLEPAVCVQEDDGELDAMSATASVDAPQVVAPAPLEPVVPEVVASSPETSSVATPAVAVVAPYSYRPPTNPSREPASYRRVFVTRPAPVPRPDSIPDSLFLNPSSFVYTSAVPGSPMSRSSSTMSAATTITRRSKAVTLESFDILRVLGKGCAGKVLLVRKKGTDELFALKAITKRHVLAHRELAHTRTEQAILKKCAQDESFPFIVKLHYSFVDVDTLYLALDFHPGGDLATQLARWGRLGRDRTRFYICEIIDGVASLHRAGIIYRDLKPENILISATGHIVLTDFGLSKSFDSTIEPRNGLPQPRWHPVRAASTPPAVLAYLHEFALATPETSPYFTSTFCGTSEYLAPEVLLGEAYTFSADWFSAGTLLYEMLAGIVPFYAEDHATMYRRVLHDELRFDGSARGCFDDDTMLLVRGMLQRNPALRINHTSMVRHPYFAMIDWQLIRLKRYQPPFVPTLNPDDPLDTSHFEDMFLSLPPMVKGGDGDDPSDEPGAERDPPTGEPQAAVDDDGRDVFDGYSYYGRDSASIHREEMIDDEEDKASRMVDEPSSIVVDEPASVVVDEPASIVVVDEPASMSAHEDEMSEPAEGPSAEGMDEDATTPTHDQPDSVMEDELVVTKQPAATTAPAEQVDNDIQPDRLPESTTPRTASTVDATMSTDPQPTLSSLDAAESTSDVSGQLDVERPRQLSRSSILESLAEEQPRKAASTVATYVLVEEPDEEASDSEWDVVERAVDVGGFVRNGGREATLWQRGFRDRYRLVVAPLASPSRPPVAGRKLSGQRTAHASTASTTSSLQVTSPATTPEPPSPRPSAMRRLTSIRSSTSAQGKRGGGLRPKHSLDATLYAAANGLVSTSASAPPTPGITVNASRKTLSPSESSSQPGSIEAPSSPGTTPRKAGRALKAFAKSAFLSTPSSKA
ncbi:hypothetical protein JCM8208_001638 [Rhodotorula glutinis]